jgi:hypothetical protein
MRESPDAVKDQDAEHPVASVWRPAFHEIVRAIIRGGELLPQNIPSLRSVDSETEKRMRAYVASYGATLVDLPEDTWSTSVAQWMGMHWEVLVDLWTAEEGRSDLVLHARVFEGLDEYEIEIDGIWVP